MSESMTKQLERYKVLLEASGREVSRLSETVKLQSEALRRERTETEKWERRFDKLLELR